jgi:energy-coupling factor transport system ATP-binding protein
MTVVRLDRVGHVYDAGLPSARRALAGITLAIDERQRVAILGPSGSGKSTLAEILAGVLSPSEGLVEYARGDGGVTAPVRLLFQFPEVQLFAPTVLDDVAFGPRNAGLDDAAARAREALRVCRVAEALHGRAPWALSDGERRRVALAGILALEPRLVVLDEPEVGLDREGRDRLEEILADLVGRGTGVVVATHDAELAARTATRVLLLEEGRVAHDGGWGALLAEPERLRAAGVEPPGTAVVLAELARRGWPVRVGLADAAGAAREIVEAARRRSGAADARRPAEPRRENRPDG